MRYVPAVLGWWGWSGYVPLLRVIWADMPPDREHRCVAAGQVAQALASPLLRLTQLRQSLLMRRPRL